MTSPAGRYLFVIDQLSSGGAQQQLILLARQFRAQGQAVTILAYHRHPFQTQLTRGLDARLEILKPSGWQSLATVNAISRLLRAESHAGILSYLTGPNLYAILGRWRSGCTVPLVISERSSNNNPNRGWKQRLAERMYGCANAIVFNSHHQRKHFEQTRKNLRPRFLTIWNGVDVERFSYHPLPEHETPFRLACVGQIGPFKQPELVMRGLALARRQTGWPLEVTWFARRYPNLTPEEQREKSRLDRVLGELGITTAWHWRAETDSLEQELPKFQALIHASRVEGLPNAVCEALASGRPVLASHTLDHPLLVRTQQTGYLFDPLDPASLAEAIETYARLPKGTRQQMGQAARAFARTHLSPESLGRSYLELFWELASTRKQ